MHNSEHINFQLPDLQDQQSLKLSLGFFLEWGGAGVYFFSKKGENFLWGGEGGKTNLTPPFSLFAMGGGG